MYRYRRSARHVGAALVMSAALAAGCTDGQQAAQQDGPGSGPASAVGTPPPVPSGKAGTGGDRERINAAARADLQPRIDRLLEKQPITFFPDSAQVTPQGQQTIVDLSWMITSSPGDLRFELVGYTEPGPGSRESARDLAAKRSRAVADQLAQQGVAADLLQPRGAGNVPSASGPARRVDVRVL